MTLATLFNFAPALVFLALAAVATAKADTINVSTSVVTPLMLGASNDTISFGAESTSAAAAAEIHFATGTFYVGYSPIPDQTIFFSFVDSITVNGVTRDVTILGEDDVTAAVDVLKIFAGGPVSFGDATFTLEGFTSDAGGVGASLPLDLTADVTVTPEPSSFLLLATGLLGAATMTRRFAKG